MQINIDSSTICVHLGDSKHLPMQTLYFPIITDTKGKQFIKFNDPLEATHFLNSWLDIDPTDSSSMEVDGDDLVDLNYFKACHQAKQSPSQEIEFFDWVEAFEPIERPNGAEGDYLHSRSSLEFQVVKNAQEGTVWTQIESDEFHIAKGIHVVNAEGYYITRHPAPDYLTFVYDEDDR